MHDHKACANSGGWAKKNVPKIRSRVTKIKGKF